VSILITEFEDVPGNPKKDVEEVAQAWVENHPEIVNDWIKGIEK
jgi:ABC-type proline/glycine betaine transport system substrate-binding protein